MKTWEERGRYGRWLVTARVSRGFGTQKLAREALEAAGIEIGSAYAEYESGRKVPSRNHMPLLEGFWGPFSDPLGTTEAPDDLLGAINALALEMRLAHGEQTAALRGVEKALQAVAKARTPAGS